MCHCLLGFSEKVSHQFLTIMGATNLDMIKLISQSFSRNEHHLVRAL